MRPERLYQVEWREEYRDRHQERRFKTSFRAARQAAAVLAAPEDIARLLGVWVSNGGRGRIEWEPVDVDALIASVSDDQDAADEDETEMTIAERLDTIRDAWTQHRDREEATP